MRTMRFLVLMMLLATACQKDNSSKPSGILPEDGFRLQINDTLLLIAEHIDFYDFSSHLIYLKEGSDFSCPEKGSFKVFIAEDEIFSGVIHPMYASSLPTGPAIYAAPCLYGDYAIAIDFAPHPEPDLHVSDPRGDSRIADILQKQNIYRAGLMAEILDVNPQGCCAMSITLRLTNQEDSSVLYLDPDKMGMELFHYFTTGLYLLDEQNQIFTHHLTAQSPADFNTWERKWLSVLDSQESTIITLNYEHFDAITQGQYKANFTFPGLSRQVNRNELIQKDGRIWLGNLRLNQRVELE